ncbi:MAG TPA: hypothetical protein VN132_08300, partial [Bdellovibrio sp.]|nr:hypothetical protein [Bdellovibrio sp.]
AASDASVPSAMLSLKDPRPEVITRTWKYFAGFKAQSFKAHGNVTTDAGSNVDLGENSSTFMPGLMMGFTGPEWQAGRAAWSLGLRGDASFASQGVTVTFPTGYSASDVRLNTMLFAVGPEFSFKLQNLPWLAFVFSPQYGNVNYTQTSSNQFARFSKQTSYLAWNYGLEMSFTKKWSVFSEYSQRNLRDSHQEIALQQNNFELGTRVAW